MKIQSFLEHHGIAANPFADEDAQTDLVFKGYCIRTRTIRPGTRSTAIRPSRPRRSCSARRARARRPCGCRSPGTWPTTTPTIPTTRVFVVEYDDFNPFLDRFRERFRRPRGAGRIGCWSSGSSGTTWTRFCRWRDAIGRSDSGSPAGPPSRRPATRPLPVESLDAVAGPRRAAAGGLLRPIDGREAAKIAGGDCGGSCVFPPGGEVGPGRWRLS